MTGIGRLALAAIALAGCGMQAGCFVLPQPEPFSTDFVASQLDLTRVKGVPAAALAALPAAAAGGESEAAPERTGVSGLGDGSMALDRVVVHATTVRPRAPNYTSEQTAALLCNATRYNFNIAGSERIHAATLRAEQARRDLDGEKISARQFDEIETRRQDALLSDLLPVPVLNWFIKPWETKDDLPKPVSGQLAIENTDLFTFTENGREVIAVSGVVRNRGGERAATPPVALRALDRWNFAIAGQTSLLPFETIGPGEALPFELRMINPPETAMEVYVHFAPPFLYRARRDCDFVSAGEAAPTAQPQDGYSAAELNMLTLFFRRESEAAWRCQVEKRCDAGQAAQRMNWRDMFVIAEATDEAWATRVAAQASRRRNAPEKEIADTDRALDAALAHVRELGAAALVRSGQSIGGVEVNMARATYGRDAAGLHVEIAGTVANTGDTARQIDTLMVAFVDRLELPLSSAAIPWGLVLQPGESQPFARRIAAGAARGTPGVKMAWGESRETSPARIPPEDIAWQVRVGVMAPGEK